MTQRRYRCSVNASATADDDMEELGTVDDLALRAFGHDRQRAILRLISVIADIRWQLEQVEDAMESGKPLTASRMRQVVSLAGDAATTAGALDVLTEWGGVFTSQGATEGTEKK